jgi:predicted metal-dependent phosphotriesterase family hydrolase
VTRREVVTTGALGALAAAAEGGVDGATARAGTIAEVGQSPELASAQALREIADQADLYVGIPFDRG